MLLSTQQRQSPCCFPGAMPNAHIRVLSPRPTGTGWLLDVPQVICKGLDATVGPYTGSWPWGGDVDEMRGPGVSRTTSTVSAMVWGSLVGSPRGQQDPCSLKNSSPGGCAPGLSPPPATQVTPVSWTRGERSALEDEDPPLLTRSHLPHR